MGQVCINTLAGVFGNQEIHQVVSGKVVNVMNTIAIYRMTVDTMIIIHTSSDEY